MRIKNTNMKKAFETDITMHLTRISGDVESTKTDIAHIKEKVNTVVQHLELQNGRLRTAENSLSAHKAVGITVVSALTIAISLVGIFS